MGRISQYRQKHPEWGCSKLKITKRPLQVKKSAEKSLVGRSRLNKAVLCGEKGFKSNQNQYSFNWQNTTTDTDTKVVYIIPKLLDGRRTK